MKRKGEVLRVSAYSMGACFRQEAREQVLTYFSIQTKYVWGM
ncbi:MAG: hypothetical protein ACTSYB_16585 [Candidatus Helarchaeota archaeon]